MSVFALTGEIKKWLRPVGAVLDRGSRGCQQRRSAGQVTVSDGSLKKIVFHPVPE